MHIYCLSPIDGWTGATTREDLLASCDASSRVGGQDRAALAERLDDLEREAREAFQVVGWEGDVRQGPFFFAMPAEGELSLGYVLKQDNNGATYVASPHKLPWLGHSIEVDPIEQR